MFETQKKCSPCAHRANANELAGAKGNFSSAGVKQMEELSRGNRACFGKAGGVFPKQDPVPLFLPRALGDARICTGLPQGGQA